MVEKYTNPMVLNYGFFEVPQISGDVSSRKPRSLWIAKSRRSMESMKMSDETSNPESGAVYTV